MNPEPHVWQQLQSHAAQRLRPGFADRVLRAARAGIEAAPSLLSQFLLCAATAAACFVGVALYQAHNSNSDNARNLADWQDFASATSDSGLGQ
jgi:hypothetical protein